MKINHTTFLAAILLTSSSFSNEEPKWAEPRECISRVVSNFRIEANKIIFRTPHKGSKFSYQKNNDTTKVADYDEEISIDETTRFKIYEKHESLELKPVKKDGKTRIVVIATRDFRSFGQSLESCVSVFEIKNGTIVPVPEAEGRAAFKAAQEPDQKPDSSDSNK